MKALFQQARSIPSHNSRLGKWRRLARRLWACLLPAMAFGPALAGTPAVWQGEIDGIASWITVVPRGHEIDAELQASEPWWTWGNAVTDAYIFAFEQPENARLILDFRPLDDGNVEARFYVNYGSNDEPAPLEYTLLGDELQVHTYDGNPLLTVESEGGPWVIDGVTNYNLTMWQDYDTCDFAPRTPDGEPDFRYRVGSETPGIPAWEYDIRLVDLRPTWDCHRFGASVRMKDAPPFKVVDPIFPAFPYLGIGGVPGRWFEANQPPIFFDIPRNDGFDLVQYRLRLLTFVGFQIGGIYWHNSTLDPPKTNFESPFAFYSFDPSTREAQMIVRNGGTRVGSPSFPIEPGEQENLIRYSWKTSSEGGWKYGLHLVGFTPYRESDKMTIGDIELDIPTPEEFPKWAIGSRWPIVVFIDAETPYPGSEGIYFYQPWDQELLTWLHGMVTSPPLAFTNPYLPEDRELTQISWEGVPPDFRGEYSAAYLREPLLYHSPIDNRLHLLYAEGGVWNLPDGQILRVHNYTGGPYVEGWTREYVPVQLPSSNAWERSNPSTNVVSEAANTPRAFPGQVVEAIYAFDDLVLYSGGSSVEIRKTDLPASSFTIAPPTDKETWLAFNETVAPLAANRHDPLDMRSWVTVLPGARVTIDGGAISKVLPDRDGVTFTLTIGEESRVAGDGNLIEAFGRLEPGRYIVRFDSATERWSQVLATPPQLTVTTTSELRQFMPGSVTFTIRNDGNEPWQGPALIFLDDVLWEERSELTVPGNGETKISFTITPRTAGSYRVALQLGSDQQLVADLPVAATPRVGLRGAIELSTRSVILLVLLGLFLLVALFAIFRLSRSPQYE